MGLKSDLTINEAYGIPTKDGMTRIPFNDTTAASGILEGGAMYKVVANNDFCFAVLEDGQTPVDTTTGFYVASGQSEIFGTSDRYKTFSVIRAKTGGTCYLTKLMTRGV